MLTTEALLIFTKDWKTTKEICKLQFDEYTGCITPEGQLKKTWKRMEKLRKIGKVKKEIGDDGSAYWMAIE